MKEDSITTITHHSLSRTRIILEVIPEKQFGNSDKDDQRHLFFQQRGRGLSLLFRDRHFLHRLHHRHRHCYRHLPNPSRVSLLTVVLPLSLSR